MSEHNIEVACSGAETFVSHYYHAVNELLSLDSFYTTACSAYQTQPNIVINGHQMTKPSEYEFVLQTQANGLSKRVVHEIQSLDAQVLNPRYLNCAPDWVVSQHPSSAGAPLPSGPSKDRVDAISIIVQITGLVRFGSPTDREAPPPRNFSEHLVLVPNWDAVGKNTPKGARRWLIQSQMWRAL